LGGSGNHNYAYVVHPSPRLLDEDWVPVGGSAWSFANITNVMNSYETYHGNTSLSPRGTSGPIQIQQVVEDPVPTSFGNKFFSALESNLPPPDVGHTPFVVDYNGGYNTFINTSPQFFSRGTNLRSSTGIDFTNLNVTSKLGFGVGGRKLRIKFGALADIILFNGTKAYGVRYTVNGQTMIVVARKRIILTAYTIPSPTLLQRSGYGDATVLSSLGINVVYDNPNVGQNLQNHVGSIFIMASNVTSSTGFLTQQAYLSVLPEVNGRRLVQLLLSPLLSSTGVGGLDTVLGISTLPAGWFPYAVYTAVMFPASRGTVQISSKEPAVEPMIFSGIFSDPTNRDLRAVSGAWRSLYNTLVDLRSHDPKSFRQMYPPESALLSGIDSDLFPYIQGLPFIHEHWAGTCSMGTVVDRDLSLIGVEGVTVADLSVAPFVNDGNTCTMAMFIAQQAANNLLNMFT